MNHSLAEHGLNNAPPQNVQSGANALCIMQVFSTLAYSVLYSTLILYMTKSLKMGDLLATSLMGSFIALNYFLHLLGGYIGGRYLSYRALFCLSMMLQVTGCLFISSPNSNMLLWGLAIFLSGSGINVTCINCMLTQLFEPNDKRRESAFLWNYSGMNIGFLMGFTLGGYFDLHHAYHELFILSGVGNFIAFCLAIYNWKLLGDQNTAYTQRTPSSRKWFQFIGVTMTAFLVIILRGLLNVTAFCNQLILVLGALMLFLLIFYALTDPHKAARKKLWAFIILGLASLIFWALYQLAPMGMNLFIERNVNRNIFGFIIAPQWVQNINAVAIIFGGPLLGILLTRMRARGMNVNLPLQFSLSLFIIGLAFAILPIGIYFADPAGYVAFHWIAASYVLQSVGELLLSPIGYAMVGQLAPLKLRGLLMGVWMMVTGIASIFSGRFSESALSAASSVDPLISNAAYSHTFGMLGASAMAMGMLLFLCVPLVAYLTQENEMVGEVEGVLVTAEEM